MGNKPKETKSAGGVVINSNGDVLVVSQHGTSWSLPKGHIDAGESALNAAKREIFEESGLDKLELVRELDSYERFKIGSHGGDDRSELKKISMFLFKTDKNVLQPIDSENLEARWVKRGEVAALLTHQKDKEFYLKALKEI